MCAAGRNGVRDGAMRNGLLVEDPRVAQNKVQYQEGFSLSEFIQAYGT
jgi:hypothetical protein